MIKIIYFQNKFIFKYNLWRLADIDNNSLDLGHHINDFISGVKVVIELQIPLQNFKAS